MLIDPAERGPDHRPVVPAPGHHLTAGRFGGAAQPLAHRRRLKVPCLAAQEVGAVDADADLGMVAEADQGILGGDPAAAPASALGCLASRDVRVSGHGGSRLLVVSVGLSGRPHPEGAAAAVRASYGNWAGIGWMSGPCPATATVRLYEARRAAASAR